MINFEKHKDEMIKYDFINCKCKLKRELIGIDCSKIKCGDCKKIAEEWLEAEYVEPEVDWSKVLMGTPVSVWSDINRKYERTFITYCEDSIFPFTVIDMTTKSIGYWKCAELIEVDDENSNTND